MTREEALSIATGLRTDFKCESNTMVEFCNTVIEALSAEPCDYCNCDKDGYIKPIDKRGHLFVDANIPDVNIVVRANGMVRKYPIKYCPICGRKFDLRG